MIITQYKDFKDYPQLVDLLKNRGLIISDDSKVIAFLKNIHYYRLSVYFIPFQYPKDSNKTDIFLPNTKFENIELLYNFDCELRRFIFYYLEKLELLLRSQIAHIHTKIYGPFGYIENEKSLKRDLKTLDSNLFSDFMTTINKEKSRGNEDFIKHLKNKYDIDDLPLWALVEITTFGNLIKFFRLMQKNEQLQILEFFDIKKLQLNVFSNWLNTLSYVRNICAHHARLWNKIFVKKFKFDSNFDFLESRIARDRIFFALSVLAIILKDKNIKIELINLLKKYLNIDLNAMGFPTNWLELSPWDKL
ncbi:hypothetical protein DCO58_10590 [Helicobacter saguini]|uniref:CAAX protease n=1 Tax=Helicobacter saguini TaxID=1548018 RepID=A0A347VPR0_9HELI|nr:Abi family protein [Helicobacter saguini]MWV61253.1 hypothetical protein [Helicobacter saguini]MWV68080.1 hypothetical protein [Helicobacter saguini]MWV70456.1 hypothetical protein [Helicobacter saguini]MWV72357.1 hypothetical protein [Helicobacter saguini]TLD93005.1 hypothetical protein LS64_009445 [Helicobacter saguini]